MSKSSNTPKATDYGVGMGPLTGRSVVITGTKVDGTHYINRVLANCSYVPKADGDHLIVGVDVSVGQVRCFHLVTVESLRLVRGGPVLRGLDLVATINDRLSRGPVVEIKVEQVFDDEVAA